MADPMKCENPINLSCASKMIGGVLIQLNGSDSSARAAGTMATEEPDIEGKRVGARP
jgi:hypothetical protein